MSRWAGPLSEWNFRLLFGARTISFFGTNLAPIAVAFAVLDLTGSATDVGLAFACWTLAQVSTLLVGGVVADRLPRRLVMLSSDSANFVIRATMGALLVTGHARVWELFVLQALGGAATAFYSPASTGLVPETVPASLLQQANALMSIARYIAFPLGAAAGGTIVATIGSGYALLVDGGTYATSALLLSRFRLTGQSRTAGAPNFLRELRDGWQAFTEHTWVWLLTGWISLYFLITYAPFFVLGPYIAKHSLGGPKAWAVIVTGEAIGSLAGGIAGLRLRPRRTMTTIGAFFALTSVQCLLLAEHAPVVAIAAAAVLAGAAFSFGTVIWDSSLQQAIARDKLARVSAYNWMGAMAFLPAGYAIAGPVANAIGVSTTLRIGAVWIVVSTAAVLSVRSVRDFRLRSASEGADDELEAATVPT
ncbi:MAG: MFS transporter [Actinobacteria bacterium]|nr:MAG: MFS transporter [Actinomycetota bacterium]